MSRRVGNLLVLYGLFLFLCGILGYLATRETSTSSLLNGGIFGTLMCLGGLLGRQGRLWTLPAAVSATSVFTLTFLWRGILQWYHAVTDDTSRWIVAVLLTLMFAASCAMLVVLLKHYRHR
jgi:uncharacterized membrane protein (UPF0136 family)